MCTYYDGSGGTRCSTDGVGRGCVRVVLAGCGGGGSEATKEGGRRVVRAEPERKRRGCDRGEGS